MGSINFSGVQTGVDWDALIQYEIQARRRQVIEPIENWKTSWESKLSAFDQLRSELGELQNAAEDMDSAVELSSHTADSGDDNLLGVSVSGAATRGEYQMLVNQLADAEVEIHSGVDDEATVLNNSGATQQITYTYGGESVTVQVADGTTLQGVVALINNDSNNPGVTASILDDGGDHATSHHLVLRGDDTGADYPISINSGSTTLAGDWGTLTGDASSGASSVDVDDASSFARHQAIIVNDDDSSAEYHIIDSISTDTLNLRSALSGDFNTAQNAYATPRGIGSGLADTASSGATEVTVSDASHFQVGKTVVIADASSYEEATISAVNTTTNTLTFETTLSNGYDAGGYVTQLEGGRKFTFEDTDFTENQTAQNAQIRMDGYPPAGWIERTTNTIANVIEGVTLTLKGSTSGSAVAVTVNSDPEGVKEKINAFVSAYNSVKTFLNNSTDYNTDSEEAGVLLGNYTAELIESQLSEVIINLAPGFEDGAETYTHLGQVGIETAGTASEEGALGTLTVDEMVLDAALADDFDAVVSLFADSFSGYSNSDYLQFHQASENLTTPGKYDVQADFDAGGNLTGGRIKLTTESTYRDATVSDGYLVGASDNPEENLWVECEWDGVSSTQSATVRVTQGIAGRVGAVLDEILDTTDGAIHNIDESYGEILSNLDDRIAEEEERLEQMKERLVAKYARLEQLLMELQGQQNWAQQMGNSLAWDKE